jgi:glutamine amidotransferase
MGNFKSVSNMIRQIGFPSQTATNPSELPLSSHVILPGVGSFDRAMELLTTGGWVEALNAYTEAPGTHLLGICLGAQLLGRGSDEGKSQGLGFLDFETVKFPENIGLPVPHMRWNSVRKTDEAPNWLSVSDNSRFYFAHSYYFKAGKATPYLETVYGVPFSSALGTGNIVAFQFHPEKSHRFGKEALRSFLEWE